MFNPQVGDIGLEFIVHLQTQDCTGATIDFDISTATTREICLKKPDGTVTTHSAVFTPAPCGTADGTDGKISYVTVSGDLDQAGTWAVAAHVVLSGGQDLRSNSSTFEVETPVC